MSLQDPLADLFSRIRNAQLRKKKVVTSPLSKMRESILEVLKNEGYIRGYHAELDPEKLGFEVTVFAMVGLHNQAEADLLSFEEHVSNLDYVRECHMLNGEIDFILKCVAPDLSSFQNFLTNELTSAPNVASVKTSLTIRQSKYLPGVPLK